MPIIITNQQTKVKTTVNLNAGARYSAVVDTIISQPVVNSVRSIRGIVRSEARRLLIELKADSPVGFTRNLRNRWKINTFVNRNNNNRQVQLIANISNSAPQSYYRIVGRAPGKKPPIAPLLNWVKAKKLPRYRAYQIQKRIAKYGTRRWQTGENVLGIRKGIDPNTADYTKLYKSDSAISRLLGRIAARIN